MHTTLLLGTGRSEAASRQVADAIAAALTDRAVPFDYSKVGDILTDAHTVAPSDQSLTPAQAHWNAQVAKTDLFIMVVPEYNHSFPGEWKLLMDMLPIKAYRGKKVAMVTVSAGSFAGVRVMEHVLPVLVNLELTILPERLHVGKVKEVFQHGMLHDEHVGQRIDSFVSSFISSYL